MKGQIDLGGGFAYRFYVWSPDRKLNPQYEGVPDLDPAGIILTCAHGVEGGVSFEGLPGEGPRWTVESLDPLTLSPSIDTGCCHGFIREGRWVPA